MGERNGIWNGLGIRTNKHAKLGRENHISMIDSPHDSPIYVKANIEVSIFTYSPFDNQ